MAKRNNRSEPDMSQRLATRLKRVTDLAAEIRQSQQQFIPKVLQGADVVREVERGMQELNALLQDLQTSYTGLEGMLASARSEIEVAAWNLREAGELGDDLTRELYQQLVLAQNFSVFMQSDPVLISRVVCEADGVARREALKVIDESVLRAWAAEIAQVIDDLHR